MEAGRRLVGTWDTSGDDGNYDLWLIGPRKGVFAEDIGRAVFGSVMEGGNVWVIRAAFFHRRE